MEQTLVILYFNNIVDNKLLQLSHLVIHSLDVGDVHVVGGRADIFILLTREDVDANQVDLHEHEAHREEEQSAF